MDTPCEQPTVDALLALGRMGLELGYREQAERYFDQALALEPGRPEVLVGKARACEDAAQALEWVRQARRSAPDDAEALELERVLLRRQPRGPDPDAAAPLPPEGIYVLPPRPMEGERRAHMPWATPALWLMMLGIAILVLIVGGVLITRPRSRTPLPLEASAPAPTLLAASLDPTLVGRGDLSRAQAACAYLLAPSRDSLQTKRGSGSVMTADGLVLTNYHVLAAEDGVNPTNPDGLAFVGLTDDVRRPPARWYIAALVNSDVTRDLAVLRIIATAQGASVAGMRFPVMPTGDSRNLALGQDLMGLGYPALGGQTLTLTQGVMGGFDVHDGLSYGKTDSELLPGASGGAVLDAKGRLVGITTATSTENRTQGRLSYFLLLDEAETLLREAQYASRPRVDLDWLVALAPQLAAQMER